MILSTNQCLEMQTGIKDKMQNKPCTFRSISSQREALYLYRVKFRSTSPRLDYSPEGGLISLSDRPNSRKAVCRRNSTNSTINSRKAKANVFFIFIFILFIYLDFYLEE